MTTHQFSNILTEFQDYPKRDVLTEPSGEHFNQPGHGVHHLRGQAIEKVRNKDPYVLKAREHMLIQNLIHLEKLANREKIRQFALLYKLVSPFY